MDKNVVQIIVEDRLLKAVDISEILNISRAMAYRLIQIGTIRAVKIGTARRVRPEDLKTYIEDNLTSHLGGNIK